MSKKDKSFNIKFRGIRGSHPTPSQNTLEYGGNTSCIEVNVNGHLIIIDSGTGIIDLGNDLMKSYLASGISDETRNPINANLLLSHTHLDHIQGLPFFKPAFLKTTNVNLFGPTTKGISLKDHLSEHLFLPFFPLELHETSADMNFFDVSENDVILLEKNRPPKILKTGTEDDLNLDDDTVVIKCVKCYAHPKDGVYAYRIEWKNRSLVYASDKESYVGVDRKLSAFARNTDLLIHDSQYTQDDYLSPIVPKQGYGHSTPEMAIEIAKHCNAKKLALFHIDPTYNDDFVKKMEESAKNKFPSLFVAKEGLEIDLL